jgi:integrase
MATSKTSNLLTQEQITALLKAAQGHPLEAFVPLAMTGMRLNEMLALQWMAIDFEHRSLQVSRTLALTASKPLVGEPKTKERRVDLPPFVIEALLRHRERQQERRAQMGEQWQNHDLVLCDARGNFLDPKSQMDLFQELLASTGLPRIRFHSLRLTIAFQMRSQHGREGEQQ